MAGNAHAPDDDLCIRALQKRYDGLVTVRTKAIKGKGAWYWAHLEPILVHSQDTGAAKAVKLRCGLCCALFSASNPSRTASEHLKRGTCPNFSGAIPKPLVSIPPLRTIQTNASGSTSRKRTTPPLALPPTVDVPCSSSDFGRGISAAPLLLSGGKEDLGALALLDDKVKRIKSPGGKGGPAQGLSKGQIETALNSLAEWLYESCGTVSFSCVEHPKFKAFLNDVGLPSISRRYMAGPKLDAKFEEVRIESEARLRDALFFQLSPDGWKKKVIIMGESLVSVTINLPNGTSLFRKVVPFNGTALNSKLVEEMLWETVTEVCGSAVERCVGIVTDADRHTLKALQELEYKNRWMVNLSCQVQGFGSLLKDFFKHLTLFGSVANECSKVVSFFNSKPLAWNYLQKSLGENYDSLKILRPLPELPQYSDAIAMAEDIANAARVLRIAGIDESFKLAYADDPVGREIVEMMSAMRFWSDLEAVLALVKLVKVMVQEVEAERPSVSQCLPLWVDLRAKIKDWCGRYNREEGLVAQVIEKRFNKNYHQAWSAAFILDPLYLLRDSSGKYLPPFKCLTMDQEKDVDRLITRLVSREEAHIALMELMKWRANGLDPLYAQAVQMKERDPVTGKMKPVSLQSRRLVWETCLSEFKVLGKVAVRLIFLHATVSGLKCNWSIWKWVYRNGHSRIAADKAQKMMFIASHARLQRGDFASEEDKDAELFANGDDDVIPDEVFLNTTL
eukprot:c25358_g2_i1 orf=421-2622(-)